MFRKAFSLFRNWSSIRRRASSGVSRCCKKPLSPHIYLAAIFRSSNMINTHPFFLSELESDLQISTVCLVLLLVIMLEDDCIIKELDYGNSA